MASSTWKSRGWYHNALHVAGLLSVWSLFAMAALWQRDTTGLRLGCLIVLTWVAIWSMVSVFEQFTRSRTLLRGLQEQERL